VNSKQVVTAVRGGVYCIMLQAESIFLRRRLENETNRTCLPAADELGHGKRNVPVISKPPIACFGSFDRVRRYCANQCRSSVSKGSANRRSIAPKESNRSSLACIQYEDLGAYVCQVIIGHITRDMVDKSISAQRARNQAISRFLACCFRRVHEYSHHFLAASCVDCGWHLVTWGSEDGLDGRRKGTEVVSRTKAQHLTCVTISRPNEKQLL
jgi:hypothetical protein